MTNLNSPPCARPEMSLETKRCFRAMNTAIEITLADWRYASRLPELEALFRAFEARFSRFDPESELSHFNARSTATAAVSAEMWDLLRESLAFFTLTEGVFNPLILEALSQSGYVKSFEQVTSVEGLHAHEVPSFGSIVLRDEFEVELPVAMSVDFGGIGKGYCVDQAVERLADCDDFLISAGGDIFAAGVGPDGQPWRIAVADPQEPGATLAILGLSNCAIASSWTTKRRWRAGTGWANHLIDPRTGAPVTNGVAGVTIVACSTTEADVFAKTALILGPEEGRAFLDNQGVDGLLVMSDGAHFPTGGWASHIIA